MQTIAETIYPREYNQLNGIIAAIQNDDADHAGRLLAEAETALRTIDSAPRKLQVELFLNAIRGRLNHAQAENLYLVPDEGQQIRMFNFMAEKFPVVRLAQDVANGLFVERLSGERAFCILDIGIGTGRQMAGLIRRVADGHPQVKTVAVIGIEPSEDSLAKAEACMAELGGQYNLELSFTGIRKTFEQLDNADWSAIQARSSMAQGPFFINASFALHHVHPVSSRTELFKRLKGFDPAAFVIIEPYADYLPGEVSTRFRNAWHHYGLTFRAIDTIDADEAEKSAVKHVFFGREMMDVLGEGERVEQFETGEMWAQRLVEAGFAIMPVNSDVPQGFNPVIRMETRPSYLGFTVEGHPIVAVICAG